MRVAKEYNNPFSLWWREMRRLLIVGKVQVCAPSHSLFGFVEGGLRLESIAPQQVCSAPYSKANA